MNKRKYKIVLQTNTERQDEYIKYASNDDEAVILTQAEAIENARGYKLVSVEEIKR